MFDTMKKFTTCIAYTLPNRRTPVDIILQSWSIAGASGSGKYPFFNENKIRLELIKIITITVPFSAFSPCISYRNGVKFFDNIKCSTQHYYKSVVIAQAKDPKWQDISPIMIILNLLNIWFKPTDAIAIITPGLSTCVGPLLNGSDSSWYNIGQVIRVNHLPTPSTFYLFTLTIWNPTKSVF